MNVIRRTLPFPWVETNNWEPPMETSIEPKHTDANAMGNSPTRPRSPAREHVQTQILTIWHPNGGLAELLVNWDRSRL